MEVWKAPEWCNRKAFTLLLGEREFKSLKILQNNIVEFCVEYGG